MLSNYYDADFAFEVAKYGHVKSAHNPLSPYKSSFIAALLGVTQ